MGLIASCTSIPWVYPIIILRKVDDQFFFYWHFSFRVKKTPFLGENHQLRGNYLILWIEDYIIGKLVFLALKSNQVELNCSNRKRAKPIWKKLFFRWGYLEGRKRLSPIFSGEKQLDSMESVLIPLLLWISNKMRPNLNLWVNFNRFHRKNRHFPIFKIGNIWVRLTHAYIKLISSARKFQWNLPQLDS